MTKYLLLKHYRGDHAIAHEDLVPMDQWTPAEVDAHIAFMHQVTEDFKRRGEFVDAQGLSPEGTFVRYDGEGRPPVTDGPFAESKEAIAGYILIRAGDLDDATDVARSNPVLALGATIEVRPALPECPVTRRAKDRLALAGH